MDALLSTTELCKTKDPVSQDKHWKTKIFHLVKYKNHVHVSHMQTKCMKGLQLGQNCHVLRWNRGEWYGPKAKSGIFLPSLPACNRATRTFSIVVRFPILWALGIVLVTCKDRKDNYQSVLQKFSSTSCCLTNDLGLYGPKMGRLPTYLSQVFCLDHSHRMPEKWLKVTVIFLKVISWLFIVKSWEIGTALHVWSRQVYNRSLWGLKPGQSL